MTGRWHVTGRRASDGVGRHARVQVVRAVVVTHNGAGDLSSQPHRCGWGRVGRGRGHVGEGEGWVRAGRGVVGGTCVLMGLCRHVRGVVIGDGPCHPCDAHVTCRCLCRWWQGQWSAWLAVFQLRTEFETSSSCASSPGKATWSMHGQSKIYINPAHIPNFLGHARPLLFIIVKYKKE